MLGKWHTLGNAAGPRRVSVGSLRARGRQSGVLCLVVLASIGAIGCRRTQAQPTEAKPPEVLYTLPVTKTVTDYESFTGRTDAFKTVDVRARVSGYLDKINFKDGDDVKEGEILFSIDKRPYEVEHKRADAALLKAQAHLKRLEADFRRASALIKDRTITPEQYDQVTGDRAEAEADVKAAEAALDSAQLNLSYTEVTAPLTGRASRRQLDVGNLVTQDQTTLTTIVAMDPVYAYFDVDEHTVLRLRKLIQAGKIQSARQSTVPVYLKLADDIDDSGQIEGTINFAENRLDPLTGTLRVRGIFDNPTKFLSPGMFVRVRVRIGYPHEAILIPERALGSDQERKFAYVINDKDEIVYRPLTVGRPEGQMRVIDDGLAAGERVVVSGLQRIRPGVKVTAKKMDEETPRQKSPTGGAEAKSGPASGGM
jgi:RND family efflux transporter MFP subunit